MQGSSAILQCIQKNLLYKDQSDFFFYDPDTFV